MIERELKQLISSQDYIALLSFLSLFPSESIEQLNHYYDTENGYYNSIHTTVRIREKNGRLKGTVKSHVICNKSIERDFKVSSLPERFFIDERNVFYKGKLHTERKIYRLGNGLILFLDKNSYLDTVDYEIEIEYPEDLEEIAKTMMLAMRKIIDTQCSNESLSKSERFYKRKEQIENERTRAVYKRSRKS